MSLVPTVSGDVAADALGRTLMHEHVVLVHPEIDANYPGVWDRAAVVADARGQLAGLKRHGIDTLVDHTVLGLGRDIPLIREIVEGTGLNVIVATGAYYFDELPFYLSTRGPGSLNGGPEVLDELFLRDIRDGIAGTGVRAGIIKCGTDIAGVTPAVDRVLRASARVHRQTGVPLSTHTHAASRRGRDQQRVFRGEGVDLGRVLIGHCGDTTDIRYLVELMDAGSYIGMDRFGFDTFLGTPERIDTIVTLAGLGYAERMVLSHDTTAFSLSVTAETRARVLPDWHFLFITETVVPALLERGVTAGDIDRMLVDNPRAFFSRSEPY